MLSDIAGDIVAPHFGTWGTPAVLPHRKPYELNSRVVLLGLPITYLRLSCCIPYTWPLVLLVRVVVSVFLRLVHGSGHVIRAA